MIRRVVAVGGAMILSIIASTDVKPWGRAAAQGQQASKVNVTFDRFHDFAAQGVIVEQFAKAYPNLVRLSTYGKSWQGRDLRILSVTNFQTGPIEEKPAFWIDAAHDGGEIFPTEIVLYFLNYLVTHYGTDRTVTDILDTRGFYLVPSGNPDAQEHVYQKPACGPTAGQYQGIWRNAFVKPVDDDGDGLLDEDPPEDLDCDGLILQMRMKDPEGQYVTDERDPRLMRLRKPWEKGEWRVFPSEGIDNDGDGQFNEDWYGGYDTNRGMPEYWDPELIMEEPVSPYPVFMPEPKAMIDAWLARPNIFAILDLHTTGFFPGGTLWEAPSGRNPNTFPPYDMKVIYPTIGREYERLMRKAPHSKATAMAGFTGYADRGRTITATTKDYGYGVLGVLAWTQESNIREPDYNDDGQLTEDERLRWNDTELKEKIFVSWHPFKHPQLGDIEIGGWKNRGLAPAETVPFHSERPIPWYLAVARMSPLVRVTQAKAVPLADRVYAIKATIRNVGVLDTNVTDQGLKTKINKPSTVKVTIEGEGFEVVVGKNPIDLGHLKGNAPGMVGALSANDRIGETREVEWVVRAKGNGPVSVTVSAASSRAGKHRAQVPLIAAADSR